MAAPTTFTSTSSARLAQADVRRTLLSIYNEGAGVLAVLLHAGTASATNYTVRIPSGGLYEVRGSEYVGEVNAIFLSAGTARVTTNTLLN